MERTNRMSKGGSNDFERCATSSPEHKGGRTVATKLIGDTHHQGGER